MSRRRREGRGPAPHPGCLSGCLSRLAGFVVLALLVWFLAPPVATAYARWFIVQDPVERADAVVALSGGDGERLHAAINLYKQGKAGCLLLVGPDAPLLKVYSGEDSLTQGEAKRRIAVRRGVPSDLALVSLGATSTWEEAQTTLREARARGWRSLIIVTDPFHTRRARATFRKAFHGQPVWIAVYHLPPGRSQFSPEKWWTREFDLMAVMTDDQDGLLRVPLSGLAVELSEPDRQPLGQKR
jgi:uncharacterized SAM-binding protein YcdF (DUF218 family)